MKTQLLTSFLIVVAVALPSALPAEEPGRLAFYGVVAGETTEAELHRNEQWGKGTPLKIAPSPDVQNVLEYRFGPWRRVLVSINHEHVVTTIDVTAPDRTRLDDLVMTLQLGQCLPAPAEEPVVPPLVDSDPAVSQWQRLHCTGGNVLLFVEDAGENRYVRLMRFQQLPEGASGKARDWGHGVKASVETELLQRLQTEQWGLHDVVPGITTRNQLEGNKRWGTLIREIAWPDGTVWLEYRFDRWKNVTAVVRNGIVQTIDAELPKPVPPQQLAEVLGLGPLTLLKDRTNLSPYAFIGPAMPEKWTLYSGSKAPEVLLLADGPAQHQLAESVRFFSRQSRPRPSLSFFGVTPCLTLVDELELMPIWQKKPVRVYLPSGERLQFEGDEFSPWSRVSLIVQSGVIQSIELTPGSPVTSHELAEAMQLGAVVIRDCVPQLPKTARVGSPVSGAWRVAEGTNALAVLFLEIEIDPNDDLADQLWHLMTPPVKMVRLFGLQRAFLGTETRPLTADEAKRLGLAGQNGLHVNAVVPGLTAELGGIQVNDVLTQFAGTPLKQPIDLIQRVQSLPVGSNQEVKLIRQDQPHTLEVMLQPVSWEWRCFQRGQSYALAGELKRAEAMFSKSIQADSGNASALYWRSIIRTEMGDYESGLRDIQEAILLNPHRSEFHVRIALFYTNLRRFDEALAESEKCIRMTGDADAYAVRGLVHMLQERNEEAMADFNKAIELNPNASIPLMRRGVLFSRLKQMDRALSDLERSVELNPENFDGQMSLASALFSMQNYERAATVWEHLVARYPDHHRSHDLQLNLAMVCRQQGKSAEALRHVNRSLELNPGSEVAKRLREDIQRELARANEAPQKAEPPETAVPKDDTPDTPEKPAGP